MSFEQKIEGIAQELLDLREFTRKVVEQKNQAIINATLANDKLAVERGNNLAQLQIIRELRGHNKELTNECFGLRTTLNANRDVIRDLRCKVDELYQEINRLNNRLLDVDRRACNCDFCKTSRQRERDKDGL